MSDVSDFGGRQRQERVDSSHGDSAEPQLSKQALQAIAHDRGRICKQRGCKVCAPLVEQRRIKKRERKAAAQALAHSKGTPCGRTSCTVAVCTAALRATSSASPSAEPTTSRHETTDPAAELELTRRQQAKKHRVDLPCGSEDCARQICVDGFANERTRRHRANRPCRSTTCRLAICVAARSTN